MNYYEILGIDETATHSAIKSAYRRKASACHPDREGGDNGDMTLVNKAYACLSDPERRRRYDATGDDGHGVAPPTFEQNVRAILLQTFAGMINENIQYDCRQYAQDSILKHRKNVTAATSEIQKRISDLQRRRQKVSRRQKDQENAFHLVIDQQIAGMTNHLEHADQELKVLDAAIEALGDYEFDEPKKPRPRRATGSIGSTFYTSTGV